MSFFVRPIARLIEELTHLPGVGPKTAQRLAFFLLTTPKANALKLAEAIVQAREEIKLCSVCCNLTDSDPCPVCTDPRRDPSLICVVEEPKDVPALERTREFKGGYHILHGAISPMDGIGPGDLKITELIKRIKDGVKEVIVATNPNVEGEATAAYLARILKPLGVKVTRMAHGVPVGGDLEYIDEITLSRALQGRQEL